MAAAIRLQRVLAEKTISNHLLPQAKELDHNLPLLTTFEVSYS